MSTARKAGEPAKLGELVAVMNEHRRASETAGHLYGSSCYLAAVIVRGADGYFWVRDGVTDRLLGLYSSRHDADKALKKARDKADKEWEAAEAAEDSLFAELRSNGQAEMRRRWRAGEEALNGPARPYFLQEVARYAEDAKGDRQRKLREMFGDREAEFRIGIALEAAHLLRNLQPPTPKKLTAAEVRESEERAREWVRGRMGR